MKRTYFYLLLLFTCTGYHVSAQVPIKDTASYLLHAFKGVTGESIKYKDGKPAHSYRYTITRFALKDCHIEANVKMKYRQGNNKNTENYTLTYSIPLGDLNEVKPAQGEDSTEYLKKGGIYFWMPYNRASIHYKMVEDWTDRIEANGNYANTELWCKEKEAARVIQVLNDLRKRCPGNKGDCP